MTSTKLGWVSNSPQRITSPALCNLRHTHASSRIPQLLLLLVWLYPRHLHPLINLISAVAMYVFHFSRIYQRRATFFPPRHQVWFKCVLCARVASLSFLLRPFTCTSSISCLMHTGPHGRRYHTHTHCNEVPRARRAYVARSCLVQRPVAWSCWRCCNKRLSALRYFITQRRHTILTRPVSPAIWNAQPIVQFPSRWCARRKN